MCNGALEGTERLVALLDRHTVETGPHAGVFLWYVTPLSTTPFSTAYSLTCGATHI